MDPIKFWKTNQVTMPNLSKLAIAILEAPASSAPIERIFSVCANSGGVKNRRGRLGELKMSSETFIAANVDLVEEYFINL